MMNKKQREKARKTKIQRLQKLHEALNKENPDRNLRRVINPNFLLKGKVYSFLLLVMVAFFLVLVYKDYKVIRYGESYYVKIVEESLHRSSGRSHPKTYKRHHVIIDDISYSISDTKRDVGDYITVYKLEGSDNVVYTLFDEGLLYVIIFLPLTICSMIIFYRNSRGEKLLIKI